MTKNKLFSGFVGRTDSCIEFDILPVILSLALYDFFKIRIWVKKMARAIQHKSNTCHSLERYPVRNLRECVTATGS